MKKYSASFFMITSFLALASCSSSSDNEMNQEVTSLDYEKVYQLNQIQFESSKMQLGSIELKDFHDIVKANGMIDVPPSNKASVSSYYGGTVIDVNLVPGEKVKKGQVLFTLENPDFIQMQQDYLEAKGQLSYLKSDYERQKNLMEDKVSSQKNFLKAESDYVVTKVKMESLSKKLTLININPNELTLDNLKTTISIISPIDGYATHVDITKGTSLIPSQSAVKIVNTDHLHLELNIFEKDLSKVQIGQSIKFNIQEDKSKEYDAVVYIVNKTIDPTNRTIGIHGHLLDEKLNGIFSPGMYIESVIYAASTSKPSLPQNTLVQIDDKYYALVLKNNLNNEYSFEKKEIITGKTNDGFVEILNTKDFNASTQFLINGAFNLITE